MKKFLLFLVCCICSLVSFAQVPYGITYQAVIRDSYGELMPNKTIGVRINIICEGSHSGSVYSEVRKVTTNENGLLNFVIGDEPSSFSPSLDHVDWSEGRYYIQCEYDLKGGESYSLSMKSRVMSVPFAMYAEKISPNALPAWIDPNGKPTYSYEELTDKPSIPLKVSDLENDKNYLTSASMEAYATKAELEKLSAVSSSTLHDSLVFYAKYDDLPDVTGLMTKVEADAAYQKKGEYLTEHQSLAEYAKKSELPSLEGYAKAEDIPSLEGYAKTADLAGYAKAVDLPAVPTKVSELENDKNYLTEHQSLAEYAKKSELPSLDGYAKSSEIPSLDGYAKAEDIPSLDGYAKQTDLPTVPTKVSELENDKNYLTEHQSLSEYAKKSELPSLEGYAKTEDIPSLEGYAKKSDLPTVPTKVSELENDKNYLTEHQSLAEYAKKSEVPSLDGYAKAEDIPSLDGYAKKSEVPTKVSELADNQDYAKKSDLVEYAKSTEIPDLADYAKKSDVPSLEGYAKSSEIPSLEGYAKTEDIPSLEGYAKQTDLPAVPTKVSELENDKNYLTEHQSLADYAKKSELPSLDGYAKTEDIPSLEGYAKKSEIPTVPTKVSELENDKNYLTEHQSLAEYAKKSELPSLEGYAKAEDIPSLDDYAKKTELPTVPTKVSELENDKNYLTEHQSLAEYAKKSEVPSLDGYAKAEDIPSLEGYAKTADLAGYAKAVDLPAVPTKVSELENDKNYLTEHQSLAEYAKKSEIPSLDGYAKTEDLPTVPTKVSELENDKNYLTEHQSLAEYAKKSEVPSFDGYAKAEDIPSLDGYAKKSEVPTKVSELADNQDYAKKTDLVEYAKSTEIPDLTDYAKTSDIPSLDGYAKTSEIPSLDGYAKIEDIPSLEGYAKTADLAGYAKTEDLPTVPTKVSELENDKNYLTEHQSLAEYAKKSEVPSLDGYAKAEDIPSLDGYAKKSEVPTKVSELVDNQDYAKKTDLVEYAKSTEIPDLADYAKKTDLPTVPTKVSELENDKNYLTEHQSLTDYAKKSEVPSLEGYAKKTDLPTVPTKVSELENDKNYLTEHQSLAEYAKKSEVPSLDGYAKAEDIPSLEGYAKKTDLPTVPTKVSELENDKNYLTEHQSLAEYAKKSEVPSLDGYAKAEDIPSLEGYAKTEDLPIVPTKVSELENDKNYLTEHQSLAEYAKKSELPSLDGYAKAEDIPSLEGYAKTTDIPSLEGYAKTADLAGYAKAEDLPTVPTKVSELENDKNYLTEHQSLAEYAKKSEVPSLEGYAKTEDIPSLEGYAKTTDIPSLEGYAKTEDLAGYAKAEDLPTVPTKVSELENDKNYLTEHQSLAEYAKKNELPSLDGYAKTEDIPSVEGLISKAEADAAYQAKGEYLTEHQSLAEYAKKSEVPSLDGYAKAEDIPSLDGYAKSEDLPTVPTKVSELENDKNYLTEHQSLAEYAKKSEVPSLDGYAKTEDIPSLEGYAKTADLAGYAKAEDLPAVPTKVSELENDKNYLTEHQSLAEYAKKSEVPSLDGYAKTEDIPSLEGYAKAEDLPTVPTKVSELENDKNYLTEHQSLAEYAKKSELPSLDGYAKSSEIPSLDGYAKAEDLPTVPTKVSELENDKNYLTEHQSLAEYAKKSEMPSLDGYAKAEDIPSLEGYAKAEDIPSVEGLMSKAEADAAYQAKGEYLTEHQSLEDYAKKSSIPTKVSELEDAQDYAKKEDVPTVPTAVSAFDNDVEYVKKSELSTLELLVKMQERLDALEKSNQALQKNVDSLSNVIKRLHNTTDALEITSVSQTWNYDGSLHKAGQYVVKYAGEEISSEDGKTFILPEGDQLVITSTAEGVKLVGDNAKNSFSYTLENDRKYIGKRLVSFGDLTVSQATATITIQSATKAFVYDCSAHTDNSYTVSYNGQAVNAEADGVSFILPTGDKLMVTATAQGVTYVSDNVENNNTFTYTLEHADYYATAPVATYGTLSIDKKPLTITAGSKSKSYDESALQENSFAVATGALASCDEIALVTVTGSQTEVGSSANIASDALIKSGELDVTANYEIDYVAGTLEVTEAVSNKMTTWVEDFSTGISSATNNSVGWYELSEDNGRLSAILYEPDYSEQLACFLVSSPRPVDLTEGAYLSLTVTSMTSGTARYGEWNQHNSFSFRLKDIDGNYSDWMIAGGNGGFAKSNGFNNTVTVTTQDISSYLNSSFDRSNVVAIEFTTISFMTGSVTYKPRSKGIYLDNIRLSRNTYETAEQGQGGTSPTDSVDPSPTDPSETEEPDVPVDPDGKVYKRVAATYSNLSTSDFNDASNVYQSVKTDEGDRVIFIVRHSERDSQTGKQAGLNSNGLSILQNTAAPKMMGAPFADASTDAYYSTNVKRTVETSYFIGNKRGATGCTQSSLLSAESWEYEIAVNHGGDTESVIDYVRETPGPHTYFNDNFTGGKSWPTAQYYYRDNKATCTQKCEEAINWLVKDSEGHPFSFLSSHDLCMVPFVSWAADNGNMFSSWNNDYDSNPSGWLMYMAGVAVIVHANGNWEVYPVKCLDNGKFQ